MFILAICASRERNFRNNGRTRSKVEKRELVQFFLFFNSLQFHKHFGIEISFLVLLNFGLILHDVSASQEHFRYELACIAGAGLFMGRFFL